MNTVVLLTAVARVVHDRSRMQSGMTMVFVVTAVTCVAVVGAQAQRQAQPAKAQPQTVPAVAMTAFIGCVERGTTPTQFVLNVTEVPSDTAPPGAAAIMIGQRIQLIGRTNLGAHTGHKVRVSGMVVPQGTPPRRTGQPAAAMRLNVSSLTMIAESCTPPSPVGTTGIP